MMLRAILSVLFLATIGTCSTVQAADKRKFSVFVDPRLVSFDLPAAPPESERLALRKVLDGAPISCRVGTDPQDVVPTAKAIEGGLSKLTLQSDVAEGLANIILTEKTLPMLGLHLIGIREGRLFIRQWHPSHLER